MEGEVGGKEREWEGREGGGCNRIQCEGDGEQYGCDRDQCGCDTHSESEWCTACYGRQCEAVRGCSLRDSKVSLACKSAKYAQGLPQTCKLYHHGNLQCT